MFQQTTPETDSQILRRAATRVRAGWCQHTFNSGDRVCAVTAIALAAGDGVTPDDNADEPYLRYATYRQLQLAEAVIADAFPGFTAASHWNGRWSPFSGLCVFNNRPDMTAEKVAQAFEATAARLEAVHA